MTPTPEGRDAGAAKPEPGTAQPDDGTAQQEPSAAQSDGTAQADDGARPGASEGSTGPAGSAAGEAEPPRATYAARSTYRRAPRFGRFALVGVLVGALLAALAAVLGPEGEILGRGAIFLLLFLAFGTAGALVGTTLAVRADRGSGSGAGRSPERG